MHPSPSPDCRTAYDSKLCKPVKIAAAVAEINNDRAGIRFDLATKTIDAVRSSNFCIVGFVVNTLEVPYDQIHMTRTNDWYMISQDYFNKMPEHPNKGDRWNHGWHSYRTRFAEGVQVDVSFRQTSWLWSSSSQSRHPGTRRRDQEPAQCARFGCYVAAMLRKILKS